MFLKVEDGIVNLASIQSIKRVQKTVTLYIKGAYYPISFNTVDEAKDYLCGLASLLDAKKVEVQK